MKKHVLTTLLIILFFGVLKSQNWKKLDSLCYEIGIEKPDSAIVLGKKAIEG